MKNKIAFAVSILISLTSFAARGNEWKIENSTESSQKISRGDRAILSKGPISDEQAHHGAVVGSLVGFGIGHAIQGRYTGRAKMFTYGEAGALSFAALGLASGGGGGRMDFGGPLLAIGIGTYVGFRVWETIDLWRGPAKWNARYDQLQASNTRVEFAPTISRKRVPGVRLAYNF